MESRNQLFRQENLKRLSSPDDLNDVLTVVTPSSWAVLVSVLLILAGFFVWSLVGKVEKTIHATAQVSGGVAHFTVKGRMLESGMHVLVGDTESFLRDTGRSSNGDYIAAANVPDMRDGNYEARITLRRVNPIKLLFNY